MNNFTFYAPTEIVFGANTENQVGTLLKKYNATKVLLHFGGASADKSGLLSTVKKCLTNNNIKFVELGGVVPNPRLSLVNIGIEICKTENVDFILAVGGGSVIDSAKAIAIGVYYDNDVWDFYNKSTVATNALPVASILTLSAAGSEMSDSSVITKDEGMIKRGYSSPLIRPKFSILNPELTYSLPKYQTSCGIVDIIMHTLERYFTTDDTMMITDTIAQSVLKTVIHNGRILMNNPNNYNARAEIMWAGSISHNSLTGLGINSDWSTHQLEHELSGMFDVAHGAGLSAVWGSWARYVYKEKPERFEKFAKEIFDITTLESAIKGIEAMENYFIEIEMPINIPNLLSFTLTENQINELSENCAYADRTIGYFKTLNKEDIKNIYTMANN